MNKLLSNQILHFLSELKIKESLPRGITILNPYQDMKVMKLCHAFYQKYYHDNHPRRMVLGINPGRMGAGLTGIPFTDPVHLEKFCLIQNHFEKKIELSSAFIYEMISAMGGPEIFYSKLYFSSLSPLGFTKDDKNLNYYDDAKLQKILEPFIIDSINRQLKFNIDRHVAYCLGEGQNYKYLSQLNETHRFFKEIIPLAHPRFIMQYKRKHKADYINKYLQAFEFTPEKGAS